MTQRSNMPSVSFKINLLLSNNEACVKGPGKEGQPVCQWLHHLLPLDGDEGCKWKDYKKLQQLTGLKSSFLKNCIRQVSIEFAPGNLS